MMYQIVQQFKDHSSYKKVKERFIKVSEMTNKDRTNDELYKLLVYDLDLKKWKIETDVTATYNQIVDMVAVIPSKKDTEKRMRIEEYDFTSPQVNKYSIYD